MGGDNRRVDRVEIAHIRGTDAIARELLAAMEAELTGIYGPITPERTSTVGPEEMAPPAGVYVVLREGGTVVAGGGVRHLEDGVGEIKRMYVLPEARGHGHGRRLLEALEEAARDLGYHRVRLDTAAPMTAALALYRSAGYRDIGDYNGNSLATYWGEKVLS
jgi:ribosomal protein S18 acetylase RimI-like enzyme